MNDLKQKQTPHTPGPEQFLYLVSSLRDRAYQFLRDELRARGIEGIEPSHGMIILQLHLRGPMPMSRLAKLIEKKGSTTTILVKKLVKHGYCRQFRDKQDQRVTFVELTPQSLSLKHDLQDISQRLRATAFGGFSDEDQKNMAALLWKAVGNF